MVAAAVDAASKSYYRWVRRYVWPELDRSQPTDGDLVARFPVYRPTNGEVAAHLPVPLRALFWSRVRGQRRVRPARSVTTVQLPP